MSAGATAATAGGPADDYDPVNGEYGPFDGDSVSYTDFDFSDFAKGGLDLGSIMVPVPTPPRCRSRWGRRARR